MRQCAVVALFLGLVALAYAGPTGRIVGGTNAPDGAYPYMAFLKKRGSFACGASILNKNWLLTAAHCVDNLDLKTTPTAVVVGTNDISSGGYEYKVKNYISHPKFKFIEPVGSTINDIALLQVSEEIKFNKKVKPIVLPANNQRNYENSLATLSGWGTMELGGAPAQALQHINLTVYNQQKCEKDWLEVMKVKVLDNQICTFTREEEGACHGDSGSPLVIAGTQVGLAIFVVPCAMGYPDVFTRVSSYLDWISEYTTFETDAYMLKY